MKYLKFIFENEDVCNLTDTNQPIIEVATQAAIYNSILIEEDVSNNLESFISSESGLVDVYESIKDYTISKSIEFYDLVNEIISDPVLTMDQKVVVLSPINEISISDALNKFPRSNASDNLLNPNISKYDHPKISFPDTKIPKLTDEDKQMLAARLPNYSPAQDLPALHGPGPHKDQDINVGRSDESLSVKAAKAIKGKYEMIKAMAIANPKQAAGLAAALLVGAGGLAYHKYHKKSNK